VNDLHGIQLHAKLLRFKRPLLAALRKRGVTPEWVRKDRIYEVPGTGVAIFWRGLPEPGEDLVLEDPQSGEMNQFGIYVLTHRYLFGRIEGEGRYRLPAWVRFRCEAAECAWWGFVNRLEDNRCPKCGSVVRHFDAQDWRQAVEAQL
jgi:hypothetical protein